MPETILEQAAPGVALLRINRPEARLALAARIAELPHLALAAVKESVAVGAEAGLSAALQFEKKAFQLLFATADRTEGMTAFFEKRPPKFKGS